MKGFEPLNMDFTKTVLISSDSFRWTQSPSSKVIRCQFEREYPESGWATSLVRYAANSYFPEHCHLAGEQFFVLEGIFSDQTGNYGPNTFVQNKPGSIHAPFSKGGCLIFVRLGALDINAHSMTVPITSTDARIGTSITDYLQIKNIFQDTKIQLSACEVFILKGHFEDELNKIYPQYSWLRIAKADSLEFIAKSQSRYMMRPLPNQ